MGEEPSSKTAVRRYEKSPDMYSDAKIRQALDDGVKWEQIAIQMFKVEKIESTKNRKIGGYISTVSNSDRRRRPCGTCPVEGGTATEPLHNVMISAQHRNCLTCLQITHALIAAPSDRDRGASEDPAEDRMRFLYERGYFMVMIKSAKGALFVDPCVDLMWSRCRGYELVEFDRDGEDEEDTPESRYLAAALDSSWVRSAIDAACEDRLPMAVRSRTTMPDDFAGSVRWAKAQLDVCGRDHEYCVPPAAQLLPTRVLALETNEQGEETIKLVASGAIHDHYACLSHCWGESPVLRTLRSNIAEHEKGIDHDSLGATFQDAVQFCRALGIKYCWIDALCIVQDDDQDWAHESASMCNIYSNAYITLSATAASDGTQGFRKHANPEYHGIRVPSKPGTRVLCRPVLDHELFQDRQGDAWSDYSHFIELPLLQRGWVYQERVLSPRVLHFGQELVWECNTTTVCECSGAAIADKPWKALRSFPHASALTHPDKIVAAPGASEDKSNPWGDHITQYTSLALTKPSDIFPAISGIAQRYARANIDLGRYLAGLWEKTLLRDLFWRPKNNRSEARLGRWRAPSWSWASQAAPVEFLVKDDKHFACEVISVTCDTKNPRDHCGEIDPDGEATLTIRAPIVDVVMEYKLDADVEEENPKLFWDPASAKPGAIVWRDDGSRLVVADDHVQGALNADSDEDSLNGSQDEDTDEPDSLKQILARQKADSATIPLSTVIADAEKKHLGVCAGMSSFDIKPDAQFARDVPSGSTVQLLMLTQMEGKAWDLGILLASSPTHPGKHMRIGTLLAMYGWSWQIPVDLWSVKEMRTVAIV